MTGYAGVTDERATKGLRKPHHATAGKIGGRNVNLGYFSTAVDAAVAIAKYRMAHPEVRWKAQAKSAQPASWARWWQSKLYNCGNYYLESENHCRSCLNCRCFLYLDIWEFAERRQP